MKTPSSEDMIPRMPSQLMASPSQKKARTITPAGCVKKIVTYTDRLSNIKHSEFLDLP